MKWLKWLNNTAYKLLGPALSLDFVQSSGKFTSLLKVVKRIGKLSRVIRSRILPCPYFGASSLSDLRDHRDQPTYDLRVPY